MDNLTNVKNNFQEFNQFQTYFYTNVNQFNMFSNFEIKRNSVQLIINISKGYPNLAYEILNIYSPDVKAVESPAIIKALQRSKFVNGFSKPKIPQYIFYKTVKVPKTKEPKKKIIKKDKNIIEFDEIIKDKIQTILFLDDKDYQEFKYTERIQKLGKNLLNNFEKQF